MADADSLTQWLDGNERRSFRVWNGSTWIVNRGTDVAKTAAYVAKAGRRTAAVELGILASIFFALLHGAGAQLTESWMKVLAGGSALAGLVLLFLLLQGLDRLAVVRLKQSGVWPRRHEAADPEELLVRGIMWLDLAKRGVYLQIVCVMVVAITAGLR